MASQENIDSARKYEAGRVAAALLETYGNAAMAIAAMTASRSYKVQRRERAQFWLGVCQMIRERSALIAQIEAKAATLH
jgi:hypothetical protein